MVGLQKLCGDSANRFWSSPVFLSLSLFMVAGGLLNPCNLRGRSGSKALLMLLPSLLEIKRTDSLAWKRWFPDLFVEQLVLAWVRRAPDGAHVWLWVLSCKETKVSGEGAKDQG